MFAVNRDRNAHVFYIYPQVVAFDDFKRLSTGTSLAEVKVNAAIIFIFLGCAFTPIFCRLLGSGVKKARVMKCKMV